MSPIAPDKPPGPNEKQAQNKRRLARQIDEIHGIVLQHCEPPPLPSGDSVGLWRSLAAGGGAGDGHAAGASGGVDWASMPAGCNPAAPLKGAKQPTASNAAKHAARARRKQLQVESFMLVLAPLLQRLQGPAAGSGISSSSSSGPGATTSTSSSPPPSSRAPLTLVDFGCGTGGLLLPLAHLLPGCRLVGVDMKPEALRLLQARAGAAGLANVEAWQGMIEHFDRHFDVALALHACGNATDAALQLAVAAGAAFVVSPCCVGKLKFSLTGGSSFYAAPLQWTPQRPGDNPASRLAPVAGPAASKPTAGAPVASLAALSLEGARPGLAATAASRPDQGRQPGARPSPSSSAAARPALPPLRHPRSEWLFGALPQPERHFKLLARVADSEHAGGGGGGGEAADLGEALAAQAGAAEACKRCVELDRCQAAREAGYAAGLFKVLGAEQMAKSDLLVGLPAGSEADRALWGPCLALLHGPVAGSGARGHAAGGATAG